MIEFNKLFKSRKVKFTYIKLNFNYLLINQIIINFLFNIKKL